MSVDCDPNAACRMVRVYLTESDHGINRLIKILQEELGVRGVTVLRGIAGYGGSGVVHSASLLDLSGDLPLILEFFDEESRAAKAIARVKTIVEPGHVVSWPVKIEKG
jgi:PII-like signaling protein